MRLSSGRPAGLPWPKFPPTAMLRMMKNECSNTQSTLPFAARSESGVARKYSVPSTVHTIRLGDQSTAYVWKSWYHGEPETSCPPYEAPPE
jgi:hypothetical protein